MSALSWVKKEVGIVEGLVADGWSTKVSEGTHSIEQDLAKAYGPAASKLATALMPVTTIPDHEKVFLIADNIAKAAVAGGWKAEVAQLKTFALNVAQVAFIQVLDNAGSLVLDVAKAAPPVLQPVLEFFEPIVQAFADQEAQKITLNTQGTALGGGGTGASKPAPEPAD